MEKIDVETLIEKASQQAFGLFDTLVHEYLDEHEDELTGEQIAEIESYFLILKKG